MYDTLYAILNISENATLQYFEPLHKISKNVVCTTSKVSDQPVHTRSLIRVFAGRLNILWLSGY